MMHAMKAMADRLSRLKATRTQLLAGVTHELKTPVASISGLIQAVKEGVVSGAEADKFLDNSLKQADRLHKIIDDLLAFNSFAGNVTADPESRNRRIWTDRKSISRCRIQGAASSRTSNGTYSNRSTGARTNEGG